jgi:hypothetical protein
MSPAFEATMIFLESVKREEGGDVLVAMEGLDLVE